MKNEDRAQARVYFGQMRKKFESTLPGSSEVIENESGVGYRLRRD